MDRLAMFAQNIRLLIGILVCGIVGFVLFIVGWTAFNIIRFKRAQRRGEEEFRSARQDAQGARLPPAGLGICDRCGNVFDEVYFLPEGGRLCKTCFGTKREPVSSI